MIQELDLAPGERARFISDIHFGHAKQVDIFRYFKPEGFSYKELDT